MEETIRHQGVVEQVKATTCVVRILQQTACAACSVKQLCKSSESKEKTVEASLDGTSVQVGQTVTIEGSLRQGLKAVWLAYVIPLVLMVAMLFMGDWLWNEDFGAMLAILFLALYYGLLYIFRSRLERRFRFHVRQSDT